MRVSKRKWLKIRPLVILIALLTFGLYLSITQVSFSACYVHTTARRKLQQFLPENHQFVTKKEEVTNYAIPNLSTSTTIRVTTTGPVKSLVEDQREKKNSTHKVLSCQHLQQLLRIALTTARLRLKKENDLGNRAVYFSKLFDENRKQVEIVLKLATLPENDPEQGHFYRYKTAIKEIENLKKLEQLNWKGVPKFYGACMSPSMILYAVERIEGKPLCKGFGTNMTCVFNLDFVQTLVKSPHLYSNVLKFLSKASCFFQQFERDGVFMEDLTGSNIFYQSDTFDIYVVDADSLVFYGDTPINSGLSCKEDKECPNLPGNFWQTLSLNKKIYASCKEAKGNCVDFVCSGISSSLHVCGIGRWLVSSMKRLVPKQHYQAILKITKCMMAPDPKDRCRFEDACQTLTHEYNKYEENIQLAEQKRRNGFAPRLGQSKMK